MERALSMAPRNVKLRERYKGRTANQVLRDKLRNDWDNAVRLLKVEMGKDAAFQALDADDQDVALAKVQKKFRLAYVAWPDGTEEKLRLSQLAARNVKGVLHGYQDTEEEAEEEAEGDVDSDIETMSVADFDADYPNSNSNDLGSDDEGNDVDNDSDADNGNFHFELMNWEAETKKMAMDALGKVFQYALDNVPAGGKYVQMCKHFVYYKDTDGRQYRQYRLDECLRAHCEIQWEEHCKVVQGERNRNGLMG